MQRFILPKIEAFWAVIRRDTVSFQSLSYSIDLECNAAGPYLWPLHDFLTSFMVSVLLVMNLDYLYVPSELSLSLTLMVGMSRPAADILYEKLFTSLLDLHAIKLVRAGSVQKLIEGSSILIDRPTSLYRTKLL